jgi:multidrug efflux pump subunit AcrA (membrane-fusion protein)
MSGKKKILILVLLVIGGLVVYRTGQFVNKRFFNDSAAEDSAEKKTIPVKAVAVGTRDLSDVLKMTGNIIGREVVKVFPPVQGKIMQILTREGQAVGYKQVLFTIDRDVVGMEYKPAIVESPITGFVGEILVDRGMTVTMSTPLAQIVNMDTVEGVINLMEEDINRVQLGMQAKIRVSAYPDRVFTGTVYKKSAVLNQASRTQETRIALANPGLVLRHGMFADIEIVTRVRKSALAVPVDAIFEDKQGRTCVYR